MNEKQVEVIVVGAGALGIFHAYHCLEMGKKVLLLEKDKRAQEATVRNFGQVVPSGLDPNSQWHRYGRTATEIYKKIQQEYPIGIRNNGSCYIASTNIEMAILEEVSQKFNDVDYTAELWSAEKTKEQYPILQPDYAKGALFFPQEVSAESESMIHQILKYLSFRFKDTFFYRNNCAVIDVHANNHHCEVITADKRKYFAEHCFVCSGRDIKILFPELFLRSGLIVSKLNMMATKPQSNVKLPGNILTGLSIRRYESFTTCNSYSLLDKDEVPEDCHKYGIHIVFKQRVDGSIIIGDSHQYSNISDQDDLSVFYNEMAINNVIMREAKKIIHLQDWSIDQYWTGFYSQHPEHEIYQYSIENRIHIVTGIGGKGMTTAAGFAKVNIETILA